MWILGQALWTQILLEVVAAEVIQGRPFIDGDDSPDCERLPIIPGEGNVIKGELIPFENSRRIAISRDREGQLDSSSAWRCDWH